LLTNIHDEVYVFLKQRFNFCWHVVYTYFAPTYICFVCFHDI